MYRRGLLSKPSDIPTFNDFLLRDRPGEWFNGRHIEHLADTLQKVADGDPDYRRVMVFMPPRHIKSETVSRKFPAWYLGTHPNNSIILCSYAADLAEGFSRIARNTLHERSEWFGVDVASDSKSVSEWHIAGHRGGMVAAGVGGPITGKGANVAIIDDPVKNWQDAQSETVRETNYEWYRSTLRTRLAPGAAVILVMTRWHEDDLAGRLLSEAKNGGEQWRVINFPAIAEDEDELGRTTGEPLWPEMFSIDELNATKSALGEYLFSAMYQQRPAPAEGMRFKKSWFKYFSADDEFYTLGSGDDKQVVPISQCYNFTMVDPAATERETSDYFVASTWAVTPRRDLLLIDVFREKAETTKHEGILLPILERYKPRFIGVEHVSFGLNIIQRLRVLGQPVIDLKADRDKISRSLPVQARYESGCVYHRRDASWLYDCEEELLQFPNGKHDDFVDTASYAGIWLASYGPYKDKPVEPEAPLRTIRGQRQVRKLYETRETEEYH